MLWKGPVIRLSWSKLRIYDAAIDSAEFTRVYEMVVSFNCCNDIK